MELILAYRSALDTRARPAFADIPVVTQNPFVARDVVLWCGPICYVLVVLRVASQLSIT